MSARRSSPCRCSRSTWSAPAAGPAADRPGPAATAAHRRFRAGISAGYAALEGVGHLAGLPRARRIATGSHRIEAAAIPATIWLLDRVPAWQPSIGSSSAAPISVAELAARAAGHGPGWTAPVAGTPMPNGPACRLAIADLGRPAGSRPQSAGHQRDRLPSALPDLRCGRALAGHPGSGAAADRRHRRPGPAGAPGRRGFWWVKWVASVELSDRPAYVQSPFPLQ